MHSLAITEQGTAIHAEGDMLVLRGFEGQGAALYFGQFGKLIRNPAFAFATRSRRPPLDPVNALLSFGYAVLGSIAETELYRCGLDPMLGFLHQPAYGRPSLMLDLLEEFRPLIDALVLRVVNRRQVGEGDFEQRGDRTAEKILAESVPFERPPDDDMVADRDDFPQPVRQPFQADPPAPVRQPFQADPPDSGSPDAASGTALTAVAPSPAPVVGVYLNDVGRKIFLTELYTRLRERLDYRPRGVTLELRDILRQQIYHMTRVIEGSEPHYISFAPD